MADQIPKSTGYPSILYPVSTKKLSEEIATKGRSLNYYELAFYLPNPDAILRASGKNITVYDEVYADSHVRGLIRQRKAGTLSLLWDIDRGKAKSRETKLVKGWLERMDVRRINNQILDTPYYGYSPFEIIWGSDGDYWFPVDVELKPRLWFVFNPDNQLMFKSRQNPLGEIVNPDQFVCMRYDEDYLNPYGRPLLSQCYWPVVFKNNGKRFWNKFIEKYGMPLAMGTVQAHQEQPDIDAFVEDLMNLSQDGVIVTTPDYGIKIEKQGDIQNSMIYEAMLNDCRDEIAVLILGHTGSSKSTPGKLGGEDGAMDVRGDIIDEDRLMVENFWNRVIWKINKLNFQSNQIPKFTMYAEEDVDLAKATFAATLINTHGIKLTEQWLTREMGFQEGDIIVDQSPSFPMGLGVSNDPNAAPGEPVQKENDVHIPTEQPKQEAPKPEVTIEEQKAMLNVATPTQLASRQATFEAMAIRTAKVHQTVDDVVDHMWNNGVTNEITEAVVKPVLALVDQYDNFDDLKAHYTNVFGDMPTKLTQTTIEKLMFLAQIMGYNNEIKGEPKGKKK